jgi:uncharacterized protein YqeY
MPLRDRLTQDMKTALKAGEKQRLSTIRMTLSELMKESKKSGKELDEAQELAVLSRAVKQRREAAEAFAAAGRADTAEQETAEADILMEYMPRQLDDDQLAEAVKEAIAASGASTPADMGKVMGRLMAKFKGQIDGKKAQQAVRTALGA